MIKSIHIRNLRSLIDCRIDLSPQTTLVLGANGAGKSTLANAVLYAAAGWCEWTDRKGAGYARLVSHGYATATIDLVGERLTIMRTLTDKGAKVSVGERSGKEAEALLSVSLPDPDLLACMLRSDGFVSMPPKQQQDVLFKLSGGAADGAWFRERLSAEEQKALEDDLVSRLTGPALAEALYKSAYTTRTEANRAARDAAALVPAEEPPLPVGIRGELETVLETARNGLDAANRRIGEAAGVAKEHERANAAHEQAKAALTQAQAALKAAPEPDPGAPNAEQVQALETALSQVRERKAALDTSLTSKQERLGELKAELQNWGALGGKCIVGGVECPLGGDQREAITKGLQEKIDSLQTQIAATETELGLIDLNAEERALESASSANREARADREAREQRQAAVTSATTAVEDARKRLQETTAPAADGALDQELQAAKAAVEAAEQAVREWDEAERAGKRYREAEGASTKAAARAKMLDTLVKKLEPGPKGLASQAMAETVGQVLRAVQEVLGSFSDFAIQLGDGGEVQIGYADGSGGACDFTGVHLLSESEQLRVGAAISVAFAKLTGFGLVVVDAADRLDTTNRGPLLEMILASGVQALVLATPLNGARPAAPGLRVYDLVDGTAREVAAAETQAV